MRFLTSSAHTDSFSFLDMKKLHLHPAKEIYVDKYLQCQSLKIFEPSLMHLHGDLANVKSTGECTDTSSFRQNEIEMHFSIRSELPYMIGCGFP